LRLILLLLALGLAACDRQKPEARQGEQAAAAAKQQTGVDRSRKGTPAPTVTFHNPDGGEISLADFKGVPVLVNLWATWCGPCIKELPTLQALEDRHALEGQLGVIAVSQDIGPQASVKAFLAGKKLRDFAAFHDAEMGLTSALGVQVMPTSVLYDADGREVWRYTGDLDWTGEEAARLLAEVSPGKA
jgi:thiol-disulfide isomerase/thioredoxin